MQFLTAPSQPALPLLQVIIKADKNSSFLPMLVITEDAEVPTAENLLSQTVFLGSKTTYALCCPFKLCEDPLAERYWCCCYWYLFNDSVNTKKSSQYFRELHLSVQVESLGFTRCRITQGNLLGQPHRNSAFHIWSFAAF